MHGLRQQTSSCRNEEVREFEPPEKQLRRLFT